MLFGVGEIIDLSFRVTPPLAVPAGLRWVLVVGGGTLTPGATAGTATYTAPGTLAIVTLQLADASTIYSTHVISIIPPLDAVMEQAPGTGIRHTNGKWGVGFKALTFLRPKTVSFSRIETREGTVAAVTSGYLSPLSATHATGSWATVGSGNSSKGCKENTVDQIFSGELDPPFGSGSFLWAIPWQYRVGGGSAITYTTANHKATAIHVPSLGIDGAAFIEKKGAGPFRRDAADPTTSW